MAQRMQPAQHPKELLSWEDKSIVHSVCLMAVMAAEGSALKGLCRISALRGPAGACLMEGTRSMSLGLNSGVIAPPQSP